MDEIAIRLTHARKALDDCPVASAYTHALHKLVEAIAEKVSAGSDVLTPEPNPGSIKTVLELEKELAEARKSYEVLLEEREALANQLHEIQEIMSR